MQNPAAALIQRASHGLWRLSEAKLIAFRAAARFICCLLPARREMAQPCFLKPRADLDCLAQVLCRAECDLLTCFDYDRRASRRIAPGPLLALAHFEGAKPRDANFCAFLQALTNRRNGAGKHFTDLFLRQAVRLGN